jgi:hypothetical protein
VNRPRPPGALREHADKDTLVEATYFVIRVLRNLTRGYQAAQVSREAPPEARALAVRALEEIAEQERMPVTEIGEERALEYVSVLSHALSASYAGAVGRDVDRGAEILEQMRATG